MSCETILSQLKAEILLSGSWILDDIKKFSEGLTYPDGDHVVPYREFFQSLLTDVEALSQIQLLPVVPSGASRAYLIDLTGSLEKVMDEIEIVLNKVLFFQSKVKSGNTGIKNLRDTFKAWYLIGLQGELKRFDIKLSNKALEALCDSEFTRMLGDVGSDLEALDQALSLLADRLKARKKLAMEKYNLGKDQANASLIPMLGSQAGHLENRSGMDLLKEKYGLGARPSMVMDDPPEDMVVRKPVPLESLGKADYVEATHDSSALGDQVATSSSLRKTITSESAVTVGVTDFNLTEEEELDETLPMSEEEFSEATESWPVTAPALEADIPTPNGDVFPAAPLEESRSKRRKMLFEDEEETTPKVQTLQPKVDPAPQSTEINKEHASEPIKKRKIIFDEE